MTALYVPYLVMFRTTFYSFTAPLVVITTLILVRVFRTEKEIVHSPGPEFSGCILITLSEEIKQTFTLSNEYVY